MRGIVWTGELEVRHDLHVRAPGPREVKVRIANAGLCHSDVGQAVSDLQEGRLNRAVLEVGRS
jgi:D-arabinose 1-dehydrogenase-like Zn-dependent alcohol dehydrogenase